MKTHHITTLIRGIILIVAGSAILYSFLTWVVAQRLQAVGSEMNWLSAGAGVIFLFTAALLAEKFFALKSLPYTDWLYKVRPSGTLTFPLRTIIVQLGIFTLLGAIIGAATGSIILYALLGLLCRAGVGLLKKTTIPTLLNAGTKNLLSYAALMVLDSTTVNQGITAAHLTWRDQTPTSNYLLISLRRLFRQRHLLLSMLVILSLTIALSQALMPQAAVLFFFLWNTLSGNIASLGDFTQLGAPETTKYPILVIYALLGAVHLVIVTHPGSILIAGLLVMISTLWAGIIRSRSRQVTKVTFIDSGFGVIFSPELFRYYLAGLFPTSIIAMVYATVMLT